ncbi:hypothetical protein ABIA00_003469 [Bradyrhizobium ottawaense]
MDHDIVVPLGGSSALPVPIVAALFVGLEVASGEFAIAERCQLPGMYRALGMDVHPHRPWHRTTAQRPGLQLDFE